MHNQIRVRSLKNYTPEFLKKELTKINSPDYNIFYNNNNSNNNNNNNNNNNHHHHHHHHHHHLYLFSDKRLKFHKFTK